jgi:hypothetical protein
MKKIKLQTDIQEDIESSIESVMEANDDFSKLTLLCMKTLSEEIIPVPMPLNITYEYKKFDIKNKFEILVHYDIHYGADMTDTRQFTIELDSYNIVDFTVWTSEDIENTDLYKGSGIHVEKEYENSYYGIHSSMNGSYYVTVDKSKCTKVDEFQEMIDRAVKAHSDKEGHKKAIDLVIKAQKK